jgi:hypothetical protein
VSTPLEEIGIIRAAAKLVAEMAGLVPPDPWYWKEMIGRMAVRDTAGHIIAWVPDATGADAASFIAFRDPGSAHLEAGLLNAIADGAEHFLGLKPDATSADLAEQICGYAEALGLARHIRDEAVT